MKYTNHGFTLIELTITISLILLIITITMINMSYLNKSVARAELDKLYAACIYLQRTAMSTNSPQTLIFDTIKHTYQFGGYHEKLPRSISFGLLPEVMGPPAEPKELLNSAITFSGSRITFYPTGTTQAGSIYIVDNDAQSLYALCSSIGKVSSLRKYMYHNKAWIAL